MADRTVKVALLGLGTVGTGVYKLIEKRADVMKNTIGADLKVEKILVHNMSKEREGVPKELLTDKWQDIYENDDIDIVIELMGGIEPAKSYILDSLNSGKNVVTANKDLIAEHGRELLDTAEENGCDFLFEAAVAGGIPIIRPVKQCLAGNDIDTVIGIVNGTTNYIMTKMFEENMEFDEALAEATRLGYAESDPTADIEGYDAGRKMAILASTAFHSRVVFSDVFTEGITKITSKDISYAKEFGSVIKLLGVAHNTADGIEVGVYPMFIDKDHPLASVRDSFNAVFIHGDAVGDTMFYGRGAGELPTASAVMGDIIDVARNIQFNCNSRISCTCYKELPVKAFDKVENRFFLRMHVVNEPGVLACVAKVLGDNLVGIARLIQNDVCKEHAEIALVTDQVKEYHLKDSIKELEKIESIISIDSIIRQY